MDVTTRTASPSVLEGAQRDGQPPITGRLPGRPLSQIIRERGSLPPAQVIQIAQQVLAALTAAHADAILHRDVTPSNVWIRPDGTAVLIGFGVAADPRPDYLAPERAGGGPATPATDLWSLGCLVLAAYDGRSPFARADTRSTVHAVLTEEPTLPGGPLAPVLRGLLAKNTALRLSAETTRLMLRAAAASPLLTGSPALAPTSHRRRRRSRMPGLIAALVAAGTLTVAAVARAGSDDPVEQRPSAAAAAGAVDAGGSREPFDFGGALGQGIQAAPTSPAGPSDALPAGFRLHVDETGFAVAIPVEWTVSRNGSVTDFLEPDGDRFLRIDQTQTPKADPVADWESQESDVASRLGGYSRIRIEPVSYRDYEAADWEFTWQADSGALHVLNRNTITAPDRAYALYWSTPDARWEDSLELFQTFVQTFRPAA